MSFGLKNAETTYQRTWKKSREDICDPQHEDV